MNNQQTVSRGLLYGTVPPQFVRLNNSDDLFGDEFEWDEAEFRFTGDSLATSMLAFLEDVAAE